jgi:phosphatidylglycerophosphate synthase
VSDVRAATGDLSRAFKPLDCWWTVAVIDPIAIRILPPLLRLRWVTPNRMSAIAFAVGIVSVARFATGHWTSAALLYELRFLLDCLDGKIARVRRTSSAFGASFDQLADYLTVPAAYAAIGWTLAEAGHLRPELAFMTALMSTILAIVELSLSLVRAGSVTADQSAPGSSGRVVTWFRRHRLILTPWTVEAETVGLFLGPLFLRGAALGHLELAVAAVYLAYTVVDIVFLARETRARDAHAAA